MTAHIYICIYLSDICVLSIKSERLRIKFLAQGHSGDLGISNSENSTDSITELKSDDISLAVVMAISVPAVCLFTKKK